MVYIRKMHDLEALYIIKKGRILTIYKVAHNLNEWSSLIRHQFFQHNS